PSALLNEIRTTLSENGAYKIVYDRANNTIIKQFNAGKGTSANKGGGNQTISNEILDNPRVGYGEKGSGSGNKIDQVTNKPVLDIDG
ncbi:hypothetical protein J3U57_05365, partial [Gilliamella sp. B3464]|uniref:hypothetical protein n=1 Tax=unclassified Gilliamella TaxID=2685620 RepID=UPI00226A3D50